MKHSAGSDL